VGESGVHAADGIFGGGSERVAIGGAGGGALGGSGGGAGGERRFGSGRDLRGGVGERDEGRAPVLGGDQHRADLRCGGAGDGVSDVAGRRVGAARARGDDAPGERGDAEFEFAVRARDRAGAATGDGGGGGESGEERVSGDDEP